MSRALVSVWNFEEEGSSAGNVTLPAVFTAPIRHDLVHYVHSLMAKNARQPYAVTRRAGMMVSRALRLPRISSPGLATRDQLHL
jgi:large subunit ribosomal protein L4e